MSHRKCCCAPCTQQVCVYDFRCGMYRSVGATVVFSQGGTPVNTGTTDAAGNYCWTGLDTGTYTVTSTLNGVTHTIGPFAVPACAHYTLVFQRVDTASLIVQNPCGSGEGDLDITFTDGSGGLGTCTGPGCTITLTRDPDPPITAGFTWKGRDYSASYTPVIVFEDSVGPCGAEIFVYDHLCCGVLGCHGLPLPGATVVFNLAGHGDVCSATTDADGIACCDSDYGLAQGDSITATAHKAGYDTQSTTFEVPPYGVDDCDNPFLWDPPVAVGLTADSGVHCNCDCETAMIADALETNDGIGPISLVRGTFTVGGVARSGWVGCAMRSVGVAVTVDPPDCGAGRTGCNNQYGTHGPVDVPVWFAVSENGCAAYIGIACCNTGGTPAVFLPRDDQSCLTDPNSCTIVWPTFGINAGPISCPPSFAIPWSFSPPNFGTGGPFTMSECLTRVYGVGSTVSGVILEAE